MPTAVQYDPDELDRGASALARSREVLAAEARNLRSALQSMTRFTGRDAEVFRRDVETLARAVAQQAEVVGKQSQSLRRLAQDVRALRLR